MYGNRSSSNYAAAALRSRGGAPAQASVEPVASRWANVPRPQPAPAPAAPQLLAQALRPVPQPGPAQSAPVPASTTTAPQAPAPSPAATTAPPQSLATALRGTPEGYAIFNPFALGKSGEDLAAARGYRWQQGDEGPGGWYEQGDEGWSRVRSDENDPGAVPRPVATPGDDWYAAERARQQAFASKVLPTIQKSRGDIWQGFSSSYGDKAAENLYKQWYGGNGGAAESRDAFGYDYQLPQLAGQAYIPDASRSLFDQARNAGTHFQVAAGRGFHPYSEDEIAANPNLLNTIGSFYDPAGNAAIGGVSSRPRSHGFGEYAPLAVMGGIAGALGAPAWARGLMNLTGQGVQA